MNRVLRPMLLIAGGLAAGVVLGLTASGRLKQSHSASDPREAVLLGDSQVQFALGQMRGLLVTMRDLDQAEHAGDWVRLAALAQEQQGGSPGKAPAGLHEAQPEAFRNLSQSMRQSFRRMALAASRKDLSGYAEAKREAYETCVACHNTYRFERR